MANCNLREAKAARNDEFYTQYHDIEIEMNAYLDRDPDVFRGKTILLPCDDPEYSNFTRYFAAKFETLGLKKFISTSYAPDAKKMRLYQEPTLFEQEAPQFDPEKAQTKGRIFVLDRDTLGDGKIDIDDLRYQYLEGTGDFRSREVTALRDEADIIITNPPFSLFREFLAWIVEADKKFVIIGNMNAITYKEVFPLIKENKMWLGASGFMTDMVFRVPKGMMVSPSDKAKAEKLGYKGNYTRLGNSCWFTNLDHGRRHEPLKLMTMADNLRYSRHKEIRGKSCYQRYDNYDAIEVPYTDAIPSDYDGVMGVPISFLDKYCPEQFEIVSFRKGEDGKDLVFTREREREFNRTFEYSFEYINPRTDQERRRQDKWEDYLRKNNHQEKTEPIDFFFPLATNLKNGMINNQTINGKKGYCRMLIKSKINNQ